MPGYINGKIEIFCGDYPPSNLNLLWYRRSIIEGKDYYALYEFNIHELIWQPINSILDLSQLVSEDNSYLIGEDEFMLTSE